MASLPRTWPNSVWCSPHTDSDDNNNKHGASRGWRMADGRVPSRTVTNIVGYGLLALSRVRRRYSDSCSSVETGRSRVLMSRLVPGNKRCPCAVAGDVQTFCSIHSGQKHDLCQTPIARNCSQPGISALAGGLTGGRARWRMLFRLSRTVVCCWDHRGSVSICDSQPTPNTTTSARDSFASLSTC